MALIVMPYKDWPETDRKAWETAIESGDVLDGQGLAAHWRPATRKANVGHYGRWLAYLENAGRLNPSNLPAARVREDDIKNYIDSLKIRVAPRTLVSSLVGLKVMIKAMAPGMSWRWLADVCNALNRTCIAVKDKRPRMLPTDVIAERALNELDRLSTGAINRRILRVAYRDNLMLALLALRPIRLTNFTELRIGTSLRRASGDWLIDIPGEETKNKDPLLFEVPAVIQPYLEAYMDRIRPIFLSTAANSSEYLWLGYEGKPLTAHSVYLRFIFLTARLFGHSINPHLLRDCAATTLSTRSVDDALSAAALLGHRSFSTTERYYVRANHLAASRQISAAIKSAKASLKER
jgi:integrase/recombinase XerD